MNDSNDMNSEAEQSGEQQILPHDEAVLLLARQGNLAAQGQLVEMHQRMLRGFVATMSADLSVSDDLSQEVFLRALQRIDRVENVAVFPAFLRGIARNVVREHFKKSARDKAKMERFVEWVEERWDETSETRGNEPGLAELRERLNLCLGRLTDRARKLFLLRYEDGMDANESSRVSGISPAAVRQTLCRARRGLLDCLKEVAS